MGLNIEELISVMAVFFQGLLSFFSPCVLPLVPLYMGYLAGGLKENKAEITYQARKKIVCNTLFFIIGISFAFFILGFGFSMAGSFLGKNRNFFSQAGGILIVLFGLYQLDIIKISWLNHNRHLPISLDGLVMSPWMALLMGFTFSFSWTPCVGPALASVLLMVSSSRSRVVGFLLIGVYTCGFVIPFLFTGLFFQTVLGYLKKYRNLVGYTVKISGVLMVLMGLLVLTGWINGISGYIAGAGSGVQQNVEVKYTEESLKSQEDISEGSGDSMVEESEESSSQNTRVPAPDFTLEDQFGQKHALSEYKGKVVFLNFWATWCGPCQKEMPYIQALYEEYGNNTGDVIILGVSNPRSEEYPKNSDVSVEKITEFMNENHYFYPVAMDITGEIFSEYYITAIPATFIIDRSGNVIGYINGALTKDFMKDAIEKALIEGAQ